MDVNFDATPNLRVKRIREALQMSQLEFSDAIGIKQGTLSSIERAKIGVSPKMKAKLSERFEVSSNWISTGEIPVMSSENYKKIYSLDIQNNIQLLENIRSESFDTNFAMAKSKEENKAVTDYLYIRHKHEIISKNTVKLSMEFINDKGAFKGFYENIKELDDAIDILQDLKSNYWNSIINFMIWEADKYFDNERFNYKKFKDDALKVLEENKEFDKPIEGLLSSLHEFFSKIKPFDHKNILEDYEG
ncbi:helix-turn-helix transcriptional regulator [Sphingobacterium sp.]|uniref:helix-turn-helix domain-containing protein n=1 Tax=Sphingobacterium sp. TaxID=341027 RepID=UPI002896F99D|nr:helix-turn-helix transcriptional regulator [Sphingobacterium sp.]